jgi:Tfp pilus assembly protein PilX
MMPIKPLRPQKGVALIVVMISLIIMLTTVISIFRNTSAGLNIVGNMGFKQNANSVGDGGVEVARAWLMVQAVEGLTSSHAAAGYFETWDTSFDPVAYDWTASNHSALATADDGTGNAVRYVIHRMCSVTGTIDAIGQQCVYAPSANAGGGSYQLGGGATGLGTSKKPVYRVTARVLGPRNTLSYSQVMVY